MSPSIIFDDINTSLKPTANNISIKPTIRPSGIERIKIINTLFPISDIKSFMLNMVSF